MPVTVMLNCVIVIVTEDANITTISTLRLLSW